MKDYASGIVSVIIIAAVFVASLKCDPTDVSFTDQYNAVNSNPFCQILFLKLEPTESPRPTNPDPIMPTYISNASLSGTAVSPSAAPFGTS